MTEQTYKELPPVPEGTGWAEVLEAAEKKLDAARVTIRELEKRIGELEAGHNQHSVAMHDKLMRALEQKESAQLALTAERKRREEGGAEIVRLRGIIDRVSDTSWEKAGLATNFVSMHESDPDRDWQAMLELMRHYRAEMEKLRRE